MVLDVKKLVILTTGLDSIGEDIKLDSLILKACENSTIQIGEHTVKLEAIDALSLAVQHLAKEVTAMRKVQTELCLKMVELSENSQP